MGYWHTFMGEQKKQKILVNSRKWLLVMENEMIKKGTRIKEGSEGVDKLVGLEKWLKDRKAGERELGSHGQNDTGEELRNDKIIKEFE